MINLLQLSHEKLDVYQKSIQFLALTTQILSGIPRGNSELIDQLKSASLSIPLNIGEASGRTGSADNAKYFSIARGSALESGAIVDAARALNLIDAERHREAKKLIVPFVAMLSKLCMKR